MALAALAALPRTACLVRSSVMRNPPLGELPQPDYYNAVAGVLTRLGPREFLDALLGIEQRQGRERRTDIRWGPRRIDLDLLVHGESVLDTPGLVLPHPGIATRNFVLFPLREIAPGLRIPGLGPVWRLAAALDQEQQQGTGNCSWGIPGTSPSKAR